MHCSPNAALALSIEFDRQPAGRLILTIPGYLHFNSIHLFAGRECIKPLFLPSASGVLRSSSHLQI